MGFHSKKRSDWVGSRGPKGEISKILVFSVSEIQNWEYKESPSFPSRTRGEASWVLGIA